MPLLCKKVVMVGDEACGKRCLHAVFSQDQPGEDSFVEDYVPTIFMNYMKEIEVDGIVVELALWDVGGTENFDHLRALSYPNTDVFIMCFAVNNPASLENIEAKWTPEVRHYCPTAPLVLVGTKKDLRNDDKNAWQRISLRKKFGDTCGSKCVAPAAAGATDVAPRVSVKEGWRVARAIEACAYLECSAKSTEGVTEVFRTATRAALRTLEATRKSTKTCALL